MLLLIRWLVLPKDISTRDPSLYPAIAFDTHANVLCLCLHECEENVIIRRLYLFTDNPCICGSI